MQFIQSKTITQEKEEKTTQMHYKVNKLQIENDNLPIDFEIPQYLRKFLHSLLLWHKILHFPPDKNYCDH